MKQQPTKEDCPDDHHAIEPGVQSGHQPSQKGGLKWPRFHHDRGKPAHVLLSIEDYQRIAGERRNIADLLAMSGLSELELPPRTERAKPVSLS